MASARRRSGCSGSPSTSDRASCCCSCSIVVRQRHRRSACGWRCSSPCSRCSTSSVTRVAARATGARVRDLPRLPLRLRLVRPDAAAEALGARRHLASPGRPCRSRSASSGSVVTGANALHPEHRRGPTCSAGLWFAGPVIGAAQPRAGAAVRRRQHRRGRPRGAPAAQAARTVMIYLSLGDHRRRPPSCCCSARGGARSGSSRMVPLIGAAADAQPASARRARARRARSTAPACSPPARPLRGATGDLDRFVAGQLPSPWYRAHQQLTQGHPDDRPPGAPRRLRRRRARRTGGRPTPRRRWPLDDLVHLLGDPLPTGRTYSEFVLASVLLRLGDYERAANYAAGRVPPRAVADAGGVRQPGRRGARRPGRRARVAARRRSARARPSDGLRHAADNAPEFDTLRHDREFQALTALASTPRCTARGHSTQSAARQLLRGDQAVDWCGSARRSRCQSTRPVVRSMRTQPPRARYGAGVTRGSASSAGSSSRRP